MTIIILQRAISWIADFLIVWNDINASNVMRFVQETQSHESYINKAYMFPLLEILEM